MPKLSLSNLGAMVRKKRGEAKLRDTAKVIGISPATLMRVENGRIPDVATFGKICLWLKVNPGDFFGYKQEGAGSQTSSPPLSISAHFKADRTPKQETVNALANMLLIAIQSQQGSTEGGLTDEDS
jgi:transcriptional regulator with XRE-family HTH domain